MVGFGYGERCLIHYMYLHVEVSKEWHGCKNHF